MKIFLSVGATFNEKQEIFVKEFDNFIAQNGCERLTVGRGNYSSSQPINSAKELMKQADAVVVIAFTRKLIEKAIDKPNSQHQKEIINKNIPTIWNQLEAHTKWTPITENTLNEKYVSVPTLNYRIQSDLSL